MQTGKVHRTEEKETRLRAPYASPVPGDADRSDRASRGAALAQWAMTSPSDPCLQTLSPLA